ncbi:hypothetical protein AAVH_42301, partial [Aphelenchoides avenae]
PKVTDSGYAYTFDRLSADGTLRFYRCDKRHDDCPARIHVSVETDAIVTRIHNHNHGSDAARIEAAKVLVGVKRRCAENQELPGQLVATALQNVNEAVMGKLPSTHVRYVPKRKKYREADERILTIVTEYRNREILEYLRGIAHNFQME